MRFLGKRLPPLSTMVAFEAAARHQSFTLAAAELNLTQAAVSRQIRLLEEDLGINLFLRANRAVTLTPEGRDLQHTVSFSLMHIANAAEQVRATGGRHRLNIATDKSINALWLMPRLHQFRQANPDVIIRIISSDVEADCLVDNIDVAILHGEGQWPGYDARLLLDETVFPVCSPTYLTCFGPIETANELPAHSLVALEDDHWHWMSWRVWLTENGVDLPMEHQDMIMNDYYSVLQAARTGQGIALGWRHLVDGYLDDGSLLCPLATTGVKTDFGYYLLTPANRPLSTETVRCVGWLKSHTPGDLPQSA
ncbi:MAG: LysR family transcriptional regulator [Gammaproteobacteria bacterium]|nr:LysR family transcriptional regulator [Gammaproteobacteria bacterium]